MCKSLPIQFTQPEDRAAKKLKKPRIRQETAFEAFGLVWMVLLQGFILFLLQIDGETGREFRVLLQKAAHFLLKLSLIHI